MVSKGTEGAVKETEKGASYKGTSNFVIIMHNHAIITSIEHCTLFVFFSKKKERREQIFQMLSMDQGKR